MLTPDIIYPISNSRLTAFKRSPLHLIHYLTKPKEATPAMAFGSAFHVSLLQPELFNSLYAVAPEVDRRTKDGKLEYDQFVYESEGKTVLSNSDKSKLDNMVEAVYNNPIAAELISQLVSVEKDVRWTNQQTGLEMRGIIDGVALDFMLDIKTCADATPNKFQRDAWYMGYHRQAAIYLDSQDVHKDFYFIAIEKEAPYGVSVHKVADNMLDKGREIMLDQLLEYKAWADAGCPASGYEYWHYSGTHEWELPTYIQS